MSVIQQLGRGTGPSPEPNLTLPQVLLLGAIGLSKDFRYRRRDPALRKRPTLQALDPRLYRPVFIVGAPRSGTTFLGSSIGRMPEISYHFEPKLTKAAVGCVYTQSWSEHRSAAVFRLSYSALLVAALHGGRRFADKTPENSFILPFLAETFPAAQFIHILRDGRDAAVSHAEKPWLTTPSGLYRQQVPDGRSAAPYTRWWVEPDRRGEFASVPGIVRTAWCWRRFTEAALAGLAALPARRTLEVRYESVVSDPAGAAVVLGEFLGASAAGQEALQAGLARARTDSVGRWRKVLGEDEVAGVEREIGPLLAQLGYA